MNRLNAPIGLKKTPRKVVVVVELHPADYARAMSSAQAMHISEREYLALALHLGYLETSKLLKSARSPAPKP